MCRARRSEHGYAHPQTMRPFQMNPAPARRLAAPASYPRMHTLRASACPLQPHGINTFSPLQRFPQTFRIQSTANRTGRFDHRNILARNRCIHDRRFDRLHHRKIKAVEKPDVQLLTHRDGRGELRHWAFVGSRKCQQDITVPAGKLSPAPFAHRDKTHTS
mgnify:CR=1 FL=1